MKKIYMQNKLTGAKRIAPVGFSITVLFFGPFVPLLRGHWNWVVFMLSFPVALMMFFIGEPTGPFLSFLCSVVFAFIYNKVYIKYLVMEGFEEVSDNTVPLKNNAESNVVSKNLNKSKEMEDDD